VPIDPTTESLLTLPEVAQRLGKHPMTVRRWQFEGVGGCLLDTVKIGGRRYTSDLALRRFFEAINSTKAHDHAV